MIMVLSENWVPQNPTIKCICPLSNVRVSKIFGQTHVLQFYTMFYIMRSGVPCLTQFVHEDLVGHGCQANEKNAQQAHLSQRNDKDGPASNSWTSSMDVSWVQYKCWRRKIHFKIKTTTAKTTTLFKPFINFIPLHTFFVMCQYSLGIGLGLSENLQATIHLPAKYITKPV